jgi:hypothetical protein
MFIPAAPITMSWRDLPGVDSIATAGVDVGHDGNVDGVHDVSGRVEDVPHLQEPYIGRSQHGRAQPEAGHLHRLETRGLDDPGTHGVVTTRDDERSPLEDGGAQDLGAARRHPIGPRRSARLCSGS